MNVDTMITGRFDFQGDPDLTFEERIRLAVGMYLEKAGGHYPNFAQVNPAHLEKPTIVTIDDHQIRVEPCHMVSKLITYIGIGGRSD
jgi:hypothetical protein